MSKLSYQACLDFMYEQLPMFHRVGSAAYKANLDNTHALMERLQHPETKFKSIHVGGTNGKGSVSHMLASILQQAGLKVGLYTSPHLKDFRERIKINGEVISQEYVVDFIEKQKQFFKKLQPSFFEMTVGLAFDYFSAMKVDIAVIEVGLGGRLDSTNVITPEVAVITNISLDHVALLGNTLEKIGEEKAGIIKRGVPVVIGETHPETASVFLVRATLQDTSIVFADRQYSAKPASTSAIENAFLTVDIYKHGKLLYKGLESELKGLYQLKNIPTVLTTLEVLATRGISVSEEMIREGIKNCVLTTGFSGRWQVLGQQPLIIADTAHNEAGIKEVLSQLKATPHEQLHIVIGMVNDKDIETVLSLLPKNAQYYFCKANIPRALPAKELQAQALRLSLDGKTYDSVLKALAAAKTAAAANDLILVGGSTFTVAEVV